VESAAAAVLLAAGGIGVGTASAATLPAGHSRAALGQADRSPRGLTVPALRGVTAVSSGIGFFMVLLKNGQVDTWGNNYDGQLGDGTTVNSARPVQVRGLSSVRAISAGGFAALALLANGTVMAWGSDSAGQLGDGVITRDSTVPVPVAHLSGVTAISAGLSHNLALLSNGTVMAWGDGVNGELGDGKPGTISDVPVAVRGVSSVTAVSAGGAYSLALLHDGTVRSWGSNTDAQLGTGSSRPSMSDVPVVVTGLHHVQAISAGGFASLALLATGKVMSWGDDETGELGNRTIEPFSATPVPVGGLTAATAVVASDAGYVQGSFGVALLAGGTVEDWGATSPITDTPHPAPGVAGVAAISQALLLFTNGTVKVFDVSPTG
jgi:alpha-tubulin suppressor-like RCC1 family protein